MAIVATNSLMKGLRGTFGNQLVFRQMNGKTLVAPKGCTPDKKKETAAQRQTRTTFKEATQWAHHILADPKQKAYYTQRAKALKLPNAYTAAITDYMRKAKATADVHKKQVTITVRKPGFELAQVMLTSSDEQVKKTMPAVKTKRTSTGWKLMFTKPEPDLPLEVILMITDTLKQRQQIVLLV